MSYLGVSDIPEAWTAAVRGPGNPSLDANAAEPNSLAKSALFICRSPTKLYKCHKNFNFCI